MPFFYDYNFLLPSLILPPPSSLLLPPPPSSALLLGLILWFLLALPVPTLVFRLLHHYQGPKLTWKDYSLHLMPPYDSDVSNSNSNSSSRSRRRRREGGREEGRGRGSFVPHATL